MARKAVKVSAASQTTQLGAPTPASSPSATLAVNTQNVALLALAPQLPKALGTVLQFLGRLFTPTVAGPNSWLPTDLRQHKQPLVAIEHASWEETRFFVVLPYGGHTLSPRRPQLARATPERLLAPGAHGAGISSPAASSPDRGQAQIAQYVPDFIAPVRAAPVAARYPYALVVEILNRLAGEEA